MFALEEIVAINDRAAVLAAAGRPVRDAIARDSVKNIPCPYCGGTCPSDEDHACDGYLGDIDGLVGGE